MNKILTIAIIAVLASTVFAEKIIYDKADGRITRLDNDGIRWDDSYIGGQVVIAPGDWSKISIGQGLDVYSVITNISPQVDIWTGLTNDVTNLIQIAKTNISEVSDFVDLKAAADAKATAKAIALATYTAMALQMADAYGVTNRPLDWVALLTRFEVLASPYTAILSNPASTDAQKNAAIQALNPLTTDSQRATGFSLFIQANGGDLTNVR